jgi:3-hydroxyisobutyrate dehydrogenase-like beta-hydroxyacid dehydrogenase
MLRMTTVAMVSPGHMGAGLGWALRQGGARVVATVAGRSPRTRGLAERAGLELLPTLAETVGAAGIVLLVTPPGEALEAARAVAEAARQSGTTPLVADLNAVAPTTMRAIEEILTGLPVVDGSISGPPPTVRPGAGLYLAGDRAAEVASLPWGDRVRPVVLDNGGVGSASALKMCTASVYKGLSGLFAQAMRTAGHYGVLDEVLTDLRGAGLDHSAGVPSAATKAHRYVAEMREIAATQAGAGLTPDLFEAFAGIFAQMAGTDLAAGDPESVDRDMDPHEVVRRLAGRSGGRSFV